MTTAETCAIPRCEATAPVSVGTCCPAGHTSSAFVCESHARFIATFSGLASCAICEAEDNEPQPVTFSFTGPDKAAREVSA